MKASIIPIGNSHGIRLPKSFLESCHIEKEVELEIRGNSIVLTPIPTQSRENWEAQFKKMHKNKDDQLIIPDGIDFDVEGWEWK